MDSPRHPSHEESTLGASHGTDGIIGSIANIANSVDICMLTMTLVTMEINMDEQVHAREEPLSRRIIHICLTINNKEIAIHTLPPPLTTFLGPPPNNQYKYYFQSAPQVPPSYWRPSNPINTTPLVNINLV